MLYLSILLLLLILTYKYDYCGRIKGKKLWFGFIFILFVLIAGFRYRMGVDSIRYESKYTVVPILNKLTWNDLFFSNLKAEPLFVLLFSFAKTISNKFWVFQLLHSVLVVGIFFRFIKRNTSHIFLAITLFFIIIYFNFTCEVMRESTAVSMFLLGWEYYKEKKLLKYYFFAFAAAFFHSDAIFLLLIPLFDFAKVPKIIEKGALSIAVFIIVLLVLGTLIQKNFGSFIQLLTFSDSLYEKGNLYEGGMLSKQILNINGVFTTIINYTIYPIIALYILKKNDLCNPRIKTMLFWALAFSILEIPVALMYRFNDYFIPFVIITLSEIVFSKSISLSKKTPKAKHYKLSFSVWLLILLPYFAIQMYSYYAPVGKTGERMYEIYYPYTSIIDKRQFPARNKIYSYYGAE
jgi:hypothetical protein